MKFCRTAVLAALTLCISAGAVQTEKKLIRIEEDWVVLVKNPDDKIASPQILLCMSPDATDSRFLTDFFILEMNHATAQGWFPGGLQLQGWKGTTNTSIFNAPKTQTLSRGYDRIFFTVSMQAKGDGYTEFELKNGRSRTWGRFGNDRTKPLKVRVPSTRADLMNYKREVTVRNTQVTHGAHRVEIMYQRRVRYYWSDGTETVDGSPAYLHRYSNLIQDMTLEEWERTKTDYVYDDLP